MGSKSHGTRREEEGGEGGGCVWNEEGRRERKGGGGWLRVETKKTALKAPPFVYFVYVSLRDFG